MKTTITVRLSATFIAAANNLINRGHDITAHELFRDGFVYANLPTVHLQIAHGFLGEYYHLETEPASTQSPAQHLEAIHAMKRQLEGFGCVVIIK